MDGVTEYGDDTQGRPFADETRGQYQNKNSFLIMIHGAFSYNWIHSLETVWPFYVFY